MWLEAVVAWLITEYVWDAADTIPACWPQHPHLVHEIAVLADQRRRAGLAPTSDALEEWHRYRLPSFAERMKTRLRNHCQENHQAWPATGRHTRHIAEASRHRRMQTYAADLGASKSLHRRALSPRLGLVDLDTEASNFLGLWAAQLRSGNVIRAPYGASQHAPIDERDIAAVAVEALLTDRLLGQKVRLTGPRSRSARELADTIAEAVGRPIRFEENPPEVAGRAMLSQGFPEGFVTRYMLLQAEAVDRPAPVTHTVEEILGRPATDFATWAADHAKSFHGVAA